MWRRARLLFHTLIYLKPWQVMGRVWAAIKRKAGPPRLPNAPAELEITWNKQVPFHGHDPWNSREDIMKGRFCFLNEATDLDLDTDWRASQMPLLWQFNLHYFHFLYLLEREEQEAICQSWIRANPPGTTVAWHPYPTALRIVNWCRAEMNTPDTLVSLYHQAAFLYRNLETYIYGNHLLENARALVMAGCYFAGQGEADKWLEKGVSLYLKESKEQILPDGGHYERSPMYHALMLEGYLDVLNVLPDGHPALPALKSTSLKMTDFMASLTRPDGTFPLFNDSTHEIASSPKVLLGYAESLLNKKPIVKQAFHESGYYLFQDENIYLAVDGGPVGPPYLMAHAHADIFSYVLSVKGIPVIIDTGVYEYQAGPMRDYVRSTRAHNTIAIDGKDQVECWGSFRVARRSAPEDVKFYQLEKGCKFSGSFSGYERLVGNKVRHSRTIYVDGKECYIKVVDEVTGIGVHEVYSYLHFHPSLNYLEKENGVVIQSGKQLCEIQVPTGIPFQMRQGWYCPEFGVKESSTVLVIGGENELSCELSYVIKY